MLMLLETLEDLDDVQSVHSNADLPADLLARHAGQLKILGIDPGSTLPALVWSTVRATASCNTSPAVACVSAGVRLASD